MQLYEIEGLRINDSWYCWDGKSYHSFFLQYPSNKPLDGCHWSHQTVGHCISDDLFNWTYAGTVLKPSSSCWNDMGIATGSVIYFQNTWYMLYTGNAFNADGGFGLASSNDLQHWQRVLDRPVIDRSQVFRFQYKDEYWDCRLLADPYMYPHPIDGYVYAYFNAHICHLPQNRRGAQALMRTKDMINWEPYKIVCVDNCERIETAQAWEHNGTWYLYGGIVMITTDEQNNPIGQTSENIVYTAKSFDGPFERLGDCKLSLDPDIYIIKVLKNLDGEDVLIGNNIPRGGTGPYKVSYPLEGGISIT